MTEPDFDGDLQVLRSTARQPLTPEQQVWDAHWRRWHGIAVRSGRSPNDAIKIAWTRTKSQYGLRPGTPEENQT